MSNEKNNRSQEDYIESILLLRKQLDFVHRVDVAKRMGVSQAAVNKAVNLLLEKNYVYEDGKHLYLTPQGETYAREIYEKHLLIRAFLKKLGVSEQVAEDDACKLEHLVSEETLQKMKKYVEDEA